MKQTLQVDAASAGQRIDVLVGEQCGLSRAKVKALFEEGQVRLNGRRAKKGVSVAAGDRVEVDLPDAPATAGAAPDPSLSLAVLHEDAELVFVAKPSGMPSQPLQPGELGAVANALIAKYPEMAGVADDPREAGLCHRLDVETSGVLLAARTRDAWLAMRGAFGEERSVEKKYLALVNGPLADEGEIEVPLAHAGDHVVPSSDPSARPALTLFKVLQRQGSWSLVDVTLVTGVLHQVRAHLASIGASIAGDTLYGGRPYPGLQRFFLHAASLGVTHPKSQRGLTVTCPLPPELERVVAELFPKGA